MSDKSTATLGGYPLAATSPIIWRVQAGTKPYQTVVSVHESQWYGGSHPMEDKIGDPLDLVIQDIRGHTFVAKRVFPLFVVPSPKPSLISFVISDERWKWPYKGVARDYNIPKKTGDQTAFGQVPTQTIVDQYLYRRSSLQSDGKKWTARKALEDILGIIKDSGGCQGWVIESLPVGDGEDGQVSIQNVDIRESSDLALARILSLIPGAEVYIRPKDGKVVVYDSAWTNAARDVLKEMPPNTWDGEKHEEISRWIVRPGKVNVYYQREVELMCTYQDDWSDTEPDPDRNIPYVENVIPTVDTTTSVIDYDPEQAAWVRKEVPAGTYVNIRQWLKAMDERRPASCVVPWTWDNFKSQWLVGDLDGVWGSKPDDDEKGNVAARIAAFRQHFRQTFRINKRIMERIREIENVRVALLDPVTGARAPATVWGQYCIIPTMKGRRVVKRTDSGDDATAKMWINGDDVPSQSEQTLDKRSSPATVEIIDHDTGVFRIDWRISPYGTQESIIPCNTTKIDEATKFEPIGDLKWQDHKPVMPGAVPDGKPDAGIVLAKKMYMRVLLSVVPAAPNNLRQFQKVEVSAEAADKVFVNDAHILEGEGPDLDVFVAPSELSARFGWQYDATGLDTIKRLLGLESDDPNEAGIDGDDLPGFIDVNRKSEIDAHAKTVAAESLLGWADTLTGHVATRMMDGDKYVLKGGISSMSVAVAPYPSGKVSSSTEFAPTVPIISRLAMLPAAVRRVVLGLVSAPSIRKK